jgi:uncharacterized protein
MFYPPSVPLAELVDLASMRLNAGEGRSLELEVPLNDFDFSGTTYTVTPNPSPAVLDVSRMTHAGYALRLRFAATLNGPCMRCLEPATPQTTIDAREVDQPGGGDELECPYIEDENLDVASWANDALGLALPGQIVCRPDCLGLCPECGALLNDDPDHSHGPARDPRWAALDDVRFD